MKPSVDDLVGELVDAGVRERNPSSLINRSAVRKLALDLSKYRRAGKFTRVSEQFYIEAETHIRLWINDRVRRQGGGKTLA